MHEVGVMIEIVKTVENFARENAITKIETLVLQIGEISSMVPRYIKACYPMAVDGTLLQDAKLEIEILPCNALCKECNKVFNLIKNNYKCPECESKDLDILGGREFNIKEIVAC